MSAKLHFSGTCLRDISPAVRLPSLAGLSPNLGQILTMPEDLLKSQGPRAAAQNCDFIAVGFFNALDHGASAMVYDVVVMPEDIEAVAVWLADCARYIERATN